MAGMQKGILLLNQVSSHTSVTLLFLSSAHKRLFAVLAAALLLGCMWLLMATNTPPTTSGYSPISGNATVDLVNQPEGAVYLRDIEYLRPPDGYSQSDLSHPIKLVFPEYEEELELTGYTSDWDIGSRVTFYADTVPIKDWIFFGLSIGKEEQTAPGTISTALDNS